MHWWEKWPERLEAESQAFIDCGIPHEIDREAKERGLLIINASFPWKGQEIPLVIEFPDNYPYFPPAVTSPCQKLRHQEPHKGGLCLLAQAQDKWDYGRDKIAEVINKKLPIILNINSGDKDAKYWEEKAGIPIGAYMQYETNSHLLLPQLPVDISEGKGTLTLRLANLIPMRGVALSATNEKTKTEYRVSSTISKNLSSICNIPAQGYWAYLSTPPSSFNPREILKAAEKYFGKPFPINKNRYNQLKPDTKNPVDIKVDIYALAYHDELEHEGSLPTWIVITRRNIRGRSQTELQLIRSESESRNEVFKRIPEMRPLSRYTVTCVGLGSLGSPIAIELAKAGIRKIHLFDHDLVEAGNSVRWANGLGAAGTYKSLHIAQVIKSNYPYTDVGEHIPIHIGSTNMFRLPGTNKTISHNEILRNAISESDIIIDASASIGMHPYLSSLSQEYKVPHIVVSATHGAWGGRVARVIPGETGCWSCLLHHEQDGAIPLPSDKIDDVPVQPHGCLDPTFTGTSFDLMSISMMAVRMAVATLCRGSDNCYPDCSWDYGAVSFRNSANDLCPPKWSTLKLLPHSSCSCRGTLPHSDREESTD